MTEQVPYTFQIIEDKENENCQEDTHSNSRPASSKASLVKSIGMPMNQHAKALRLTKRSPFQELNMESLDNVKKTFTIGKLVQKPMSVVKFSSGNDFGNSRNCLSARATPLRDVFLETKHESNHNFTLDFLGSCKSHALVAVSGNVEEQNHPVTRLNSAKQSLTRQSSAKDATKAQKLEENEICDDKVVLHFFEENNSTQQDLKDQCIDNMETKMAIKEVALPQNADDTIMDIEETECKVSEQPEEVTNHMNPDSKLNSLTNSQQTADFCNKESLKEGSSIKVQVEIPELKHDNESGDADESMNIPEVVTDCLEVNGEANLIKKVSENIEDPYLGNARMELEEANNLKTTDIKLHSPSEKMTDICCLYEDVAPMQRVDSDHLEIETEVHSSKDVFNDEEQDEQELVYQIEQNQAEELKEMNIEPYDSDKKPSKAVLDIKRMSKDQIMQNLSNLIEANKSALSSEILTSVSAMNFEASLQHASAHSGEKRSGTSRQENYSPVDFAFQSSFAFSTELQTSIQQSLKAFHNTIQASKFNLDPKLQLSSPHPLSLSLSSIWETDYKRFQFSSGTVNNILRELDQDDKKPEVDPLDLILQEKLETEFKLLSFRKYQTEVIKKVLNKENCLYRHDNTTSRNLVYQLPAILTKGLILYISSSISKMAEQIQSLPPSIYGACYNGLSSAENNKQIVNLIQSGQVRVLYITPDKLKEVLEFTLPEIDFVVLDELNFNDDRSSIKLAAEAALVERIAQWTKLVLMPPTSFDLCRKPSQLYNIPSTSIYPEELSFGSTPTITISRDENPNKALLALLKNQKFHNGQCVIIFVDLKRTAEELSAFLGHNGVKNQLVLPGKSEVQKLELCRSFAKKTDQAIVTMSGTELGLEKNLIKRTVHYNMPRTPELFAQEVLYLNKEAQCHVFVNEEDFFRGRNGAFADTVYQEQVKQFIQRVFRVGQYALDTPENAKAPKQEASSSLLNKRKRDGTVIGKPSIGLEFVSKTLNTAKVKEQEQKRMTELIGQPLILKVSELCQSLILKKEIICCLFETLDGLGDWIEYNGVSPFSCNIRFLQSTSMNISANAKKTPVNSLKSQIWRALSLKNKKVGGVVRVVLSEIASEVKSTSAEVFKQLKALQSESYLRYDIIEEVFQYKVKHELLTSQFDGVVSQIHEQCSQKVERALEKIDYCYVACKLASIQSIDHMSKQQKGPTRLSGSMKGMGAHIQRPSTSFEDHQKAHQMACINQKLIHRIEKHLNNKGKGVELSLEESLIMKEELPVLKTMTQREKSLLQSQLQSFLEEFLEQIGGVDSGYYDPKNLASEESRQFLSRQAVRIALGLQLPNSTYEWKTTKFWSRYSKLDPFELKQFLYEALQGLTLSTKQVKKSK